ncbi:Golgi transport complex subunit 5-domain-containing protein [Lipomyces tetrasporus]|uniref:Golgi transport complex subunit 5-domain-containing protein n=1 Tax=Lipomyces tetrasporus TaxID=54092 RepID=A0AAD7QQX6_9ASCO|nr:Golgi transport complex subunit 5-domain-containing protein [Lipomyces tetrasporus]KAJ8099927.1 Golgi transport complex subunit 5-domain-containing protein [Lipomyces tetrasporus]
MASLPTTPRLPLPTSIAHTTDNRPEDDEYIDYELFTAPDFSPIAFCNSLVLATTTASDAEIDLAPAQQRVMFDLEEVEKLLQKEATQNHTTLLPHAAKINQVSSILTTTQSSLSSVTSSFHRLENEVLKPYNAALPIYTALTKLHATANLLRAVTWFMYLVRQFQAVQTQLAELKLPSATATTAAAAAGPNDAARLSVRAARSFAEISRHLGNFPRLRSVRVVTEIENGVVNVGRK